MTGQDQGHTRIRGNGDHQLLPEDITVAELLKDAGYQTGMIGKSCVTGNTKDAQCPHECGFDYFYGTLSHVTAPHPWPQFVFENGKQVEIPGHEDPTVQFEDPDRHPLVAYQRAAGEDPDRAVRRYVGKQVFLLPARFRHRTYRDRG